MVRVVREAREWSQEALSRRLKEDTGAVIDQSGIARIEAGKRAVRLNEVVALTQVLRLDISQSVFTSEIDTSERAVSRAKSELAMLGREMAEATEEAKRHEAAMESARARVAELSMAAEALNRKMQMVMAYRRERLNEYGKPVHEAVARKLKRDRIALPPRKQQGGDDGDS